MILNCTKGTFYTKIDDKQNNSLCIRHSIYMNARKQNGNSVKVEAKLDIPCNCSIVEKLKNGFGLQAAQREVSTILCSLLHEKMRVDRYNSDST